MDRRAFTRDTTKKDKVRLSRTLYSGIVVFIFVSLFLSITGCNEYTRYRVLTFFFTGVPEPGAEAKKEEVPKGMTLKEYLKKGLTSRTVPFLHGPYASQQCYQCHSTTKSAALRSVVRMKQKKGLGFKAATEVAERLVKPVTELCVDCHAEKSVESAYNKGLWVHGPVSSGMCTVCHHPHTSRYPYMLRKGKARDMCRSCHAKGYIMESEDHKKDKDCTECHNPHIGKNRFLLKKDFDEKTLWEEAVN